MSCWKFLCRPWLAALGLAACLGPVAFAQTAEGTGLLPSDQGTPSLRAPEPLVSNMDQIWEVVTVMGQAVPLGETPVRLLMRAGTVQVLDGCNRFSGRFTHDPQGAFRLSSLRGTHNECTSQSRQAVALNSALVMANQLKLGEEMVLRSGDTELARLAPSRRQDADAKDDFRFSLVDGPRQVAPSRSSKGKNKNSKSAKGKSGGAKAAKASSSAKTTSAKKPQVVKKKR